MSAPKSVPNPLIEEAVAELLEVRPMTILDLADEFRKQKVIVPLSRLAAALLALRSEERVACNGVLWTRIGSTAPKPKRRARKSDPEKMCPKCLETKVRAEFYSSGYCKPCQKVMSRKNWRKRARATPLEVTE